MTAKPFSITLVSVLFIAFVDHSAMAANAAQGKQIFEQRCQACHSVEPGVNKFGPSLAGVVGRKAATVPGFNYSDALKHSGLVWTEKNLNKWLTNPHTFVPGDKMPFPGLKSATERDDVIQYLKQSG